MTSRFGIVVGSSGILGRAYPKALSSAPSSTLDLIGLDLDSSTSHGYLKALPLSGTSSDSSICDPIDTILSGSDGVKTVVHCAGSWAGGPFPVAGSPNTQFNDYLTSTSAMLQTNLSSAVFSAGLASRYLTSDGHVILTGAKACLNPSDCSGFMPGYGLSKTAVVSLAEMLRCEFDFKVSVIHPGTIDTPNNRAAMPDANFNEWHSVDGIAEGVKGIIESGEEGGDYTVETQGGKTWLEKV